LGRHFGVSPSTVRRWLAEAGLLGADPEINPARLRELYEERGLTTREIAAELGRSKTMVIRALAAAGIPRRPRTERRPRGPRAAVTDAA
jgi:transposase